jgi:hypothetical protein
MAYELKWGNRSWLYALALGLGLGLPILLLFSRMIGLENDQKAFWNYYSPMLGYYVLISICQSHYFRREPKPDMAGLFRQFVSIFGAVLIFYVNQAIMLNIFDITPFMANGDPHPLLLNGELIMHGHFTFIVFGFFIYGFDDFMFKGKLIGWMKSNLLKALFWYFFIWLVWAVLFYSDFGISKAHSWDSFDALGHNRMLAISQWTIIMSLLYALVFKDWLPYLQEKLRITNDFIYGIFLLIAAFAIGAAISYLLFFIAPGISPEGYDSIVENVAIDADTDIWHHILYMGTFPLIPAILLGVYTPNFSHVDDPNGRVLRRLAVLIPGIIVLYFAYHWIIARPEVFINYFFDDAVDKGFGLFGRPGKNWYHQLDLYFNFTVSIIPLTHHWFCGRWGFVRETEDDKEESDPSPRKRRPSTPEDRSIPGRGGTRIRDRSSERDRYGSRNVRDLSRREWR